MVNSISILLLFLPSSFFHFSPFTCFTSFTFFTSRASFDAFPSFTSFMILLFLLLIFLLAKCPPRLPNSLQFPSIRFLNGPHFGQGGLLTYSHVIEVFILSHSRLSFQERFRQSRDEWLMREEGRVLTQEAEKELFEECERNGDVHPREYTLQIIAYKLQVFCNPFILVY